MTGDRIRVDLCVIGGGLAGLAAAVRAAELGLSSLVLEQSAEARYHCNSRLTSGVFHIARNSVLTPRERLETVLLDIAGSTQNEALLRALAGDSLRSIRWLQSKGLRFMRASAVPFQDFVLAPPATHRNGPFDVLKRGGDVMLRTLESQLLSLGGRILRGHRALELKMAGDRCIGVSAQASNARIDLSARNVVIADGGFQANTALLEQARITPDATRVLQRNAGTAKGDGMLMAAAAGALLTDLRGFYGHVMNRNALHDEGLWPYPWLDLVATAGLVIGPDGRRFTDEGLGGVHLANDIAARPQPDACFAIFDQPIWQGPGATYISPPNPRLVERGGTLHSAGSVAELAARIGIPADVLQQEVDRYNQALDEGRTAQLSPPRSAAPIKAMPIRTPPFHASPLAAGITYTMGGIAIDEWSRVLTPQRQVLRGLYAAGGSAGGIEGGERIAYVGGLVKAVVTGLRAAESAAKSAADD